jgi:hypothetical protein
VLFAILSKSLPGFPVPPGRQFGQLPVPGCQLLALICSAISPDPEAWEQNNLRRTHAKLIRSRKDTRAQTAYVFGRFVSQEYVVESFGKIGASEKDFSRASVNAECFFTLDYLVLLAILAICFS